MLKYSKSSQVWTSDDTACAFGQHVVVQGSSNAHASDHVEDKESECRADAGADRARPHCRFAPLITVNTLNTVNTLISF